MSMAYNADRPTHRCEGACRHEPMPVPLTGGRCAYFSPGRPEQICGRESVAVYVNPDATPRNTFRCALHDREVAVAEAKRQGFRRMPVEARA